MPLCHHCRQVKRYPIKVIKTGHIVVWKGEQIVYAWCLSQIPQFNQGVTVIGFVLSVKTGPRLNSILIVNSC
jgi:hypothetical protein